jgi:hypothetical protein
MRGDDNLSSRLEAYRYNERWSLYISHFLVALMMACLALSLTQFVRVMIPWWDGNFLPTICFLVALESILSYYAVRKLPAYDIHATVYYRIAEWVVLLLVIRVLWGVRFGVEQFVREIPKWRVDFVEYFAPMDFFVTVVIVFLVWFITILFVDDLAELGNDVAVVKSAEREPISTNRRGIHAHLRGRFFMLGVMMVLFAGLLRQTYWTPFEGQMTAQPGILHVVLYFVLGYLLLSQTNFAAWRASWGLEQVTIPRTLVARWTTYSLLFLGGLVALAIILPTSYSVGLLDSLKYMFGWLEVVINFLVSLLILPFILLASLVSRLLGGNQEPVEIPEQVEQPLMESAKPAVAAPPLWEILKSILFWAILIAVIWFALSYYIRQNEELAQKLHGFKLWRWLSQAWGWLKTRFRNAGIGIKSAVQDGLKRLLTRGSAAQDNIRWRYLNPRRLSPRQRILFFYLALVRRADEAGLPRHPWQTPNEYSHTLLSGLPEEQSSIGAATDSFVEARYSRHPVTNDHVGKMQSYWDRLRKALRRIKLVRG